MVLTALWRYRLVKLVCIYICTFYNSACNQTKSREIYRAASIGTAAATASSSSSRVTDRRLLLRATLKFAKTQEMASCLNSAARIYLARFLLRCSRRFRVVHVCVHIGARRAGDLYACTLPHMHHQRGLVFLYTFKDVSIRLTHRRTDR